MSRRTSQLQIRVTPDEKAALKRLAAKAGQNVSTYVLSRALPTQEQDLTRLLEQLGRGLDPWDGLAELVRLVSERAPPSACALLADVRLAGLTPLAQNLVAAIAEDVAQATGSALPTWASAVPPLSRPQFRWPLLSLRPFQLRRTRAALRRRNVFDISVEAPVVHPPDVPSELAQLAEHLALIELDVEFYLVGGATFQQAFASAHGSARPARILAPSGANEVARFANERGWAPGWAAVRVREVVGAGASPGRFLDLPHLKVFAPPAEHVLAVKMACVSSEPTPHDLEDLRFLLRALDLETADAALAVVTRYVGPRYLRTHALDTVRLLVGA